ncbi:hypothetical protein ThimaDRAFT_1495 [Thiocapsa marina 5811]|uniref:Uncharacterized protein n=2 Tax=Thiocapsa marina TaxID=244573 RepID=F9U993_9GAMM|nr:hypothetical protein ThimaDRAFT_1495 [Thiocapsa marina 5811]
MSPRQSEQQFSSGDQARDGSIVAVPILGFIESESSMTPVRVPCPLSCLLLAWLVSGLHVSSGFAGPLESAHSLRDSRSTAPVTFGVPLDPNFRHVGMHVAGPASPAVPDYASLAMERSMNADAPPGAKDSPLRTTAAPGFKSADLSLLNRIRSAGRLPVIVRLRSRSGQSGIQENGEVTLSATQKVVIDRLLRSTDSKPEALAIKAFEITPAVAMHINEQEFIELISYPEVLDIIEDAAVPPGAP